MSLKREIYKNVLYRPMIKSMPKLLSPGKNGVTKYFNGTFWDEIEEL